MDTAERRIAAIAARQVNIISREQLRACGLTDRQIAWRVRQGRLQRLFRGVYLAGYAPPSLRARAWAAAIASGDGAFVGHRAAAALYVPRLAVPDTIDVIVVGRNPGAKPGITLHRVRDLPRHDTRCAGGLPLTAPARTALDLAGARPRSEVEHVLQEMVFARLVSDRDLQRVIAANPRHPGAPQLETILALEGPGEGFTRSEAERALARIVASAQLPRPRKNSFVEGEAVDAIWEAERLIVEIDGAGAHANALAFSRDRRRDAKLIAAGWRVIRFTYRQLCEEPMLVATRLAQALAQTSRTLPFAL